MKKLQKICILVMTMLLIISTVIGCGGHSGQSEEAEEIVIGYIGPLTGEGALWGEMERNTVELLIKQTNEAGGILGTNVVLKAYDNRMDPVETSNAARKAIQNDKVIAIIGTNTSGCAMTLAEVCEEYKVPHLTTVATGPNVTKHDDGTVRPYTFRVSQNDNQLGAAIANYAYDSMEIRTVAALVEISSDYAVGVNEVFKETFSALGGDYLGYEGYKGGDVDYRAQLSKIVNMNPDA